MINIIIFLLGIPVGLLIAILYYKLYLIKLEIILKKFMEDTYNQQQETLQYGITLGKVNEKIAIVSELNQKQNDLLIKLHEPNRNAAHSRWKNSIHKDIIAIEEEKIKILEDILKDGKDYQMIMIDETGQQIKTTISETLQNIKLGMEQFNKQMNKEPPIKQPKKESRFKLISNKEKQDEPSNDKIS
jgi:hypothetical protein